MANVTIATIDAHLATYKQEAIFSRVNASVVSSLIRRPDLEGVIKMGGKAIDIPKYTAAAARKKVAGTNVVYDAATESVATITIKDHAYVARNIEDSADIQSLNNLLLTYARLDGLAIAKTQDVDATNLIVDAAITQNVGVIATDYTDITDAILRDGIQLLDEANAPMEDRYLIVSPAQKNALFGIDKFVSADKIGRDDVIRRGLFGEIYGVLVYVSNNLPNVTDTVDYKCNMLFQKNAFGEVIQREPFLKTVEDVDSIGVKAVTHTLYGQGVLEATLAVQVRTLKEV